MNIDEVLAMAQQFSLEKDILVFATPFCVKSNWASWM
jgi:hypothetical protein